jgi:hypothetical protein
LGGDGLGPVRYGQRDLKITELLLRLPSADRDPVALVPFDIFPQPFRGIYCQTKRERAGDYKKAKHLQIGKLTQQILRIHHSSILNKKLVPIPYINHNQHSPQGHHAYIRVIIITILDPLQKILTQLIETDLIHS